MVAKLKLSGRWLRKMDRRDFLRYTGAGLLVSLIGCDAPQNKSQGYYRFGYQQTNYLRPPGALAEPDFLKACINCDLCAQVCDRNAIRFFTESIEGKVEPHTPYIVAAETASTLRSGRSKDSGTG